MMFLKYWWKNTKCAISFLNGIFKKIWKRKKQVSLVFCLYGNSVPYSRVPGNCRWNYVIHKILISHMFFDSWTTVTNEVQHFLFPVSIYESLVGFVHYDLNVLLFNGNIYSTALHLLQVLIEEVENAVLIFGFPPSFHVVMPRSPAHCKER